MKALRGEEKGALLLNYMAPEVAETILAQLGPERGQRLRAVMRRMQQDPGSQQALEAVLEELNELASRPAQPSQPAATTASMSAPAEPEVDLQQASLDPLASLARMSADRLALAMEGESPRSVAMMLNFLDIELSGEIFKRLPSQERTAVSLCFGSQAMPPLEVLKRLAWGMLQKSRRLRARPIYPEGAARFRKMADMLRQVEKPERVLVLKAMEDKDPDNAEKIKALLYRFDDVMRIDNRSMQKILMEVDLRSLALAMRGASDQVRDQLLANMSKRAKETLQEEAELNQAPSPEQIEDAQKEIVLIIQRLDLAGELVMTS